MHKGLLVALLTVGCCGSAKARPPFLDLFLKHYHPANGSPLANARCLTCHTTLQGGARNPYGKDLEAQLVSANADNLTVGMLQAVEKLDSDKDGASNLDEINAGTLPGDPSSHPGAAAKDATTAQPSLFLKLFPLHSYHPAIVHFPIALFIFGALVDFFGWRKNRGELRTVARWNMVAGSLFTLAAVATGLTAMLRLGLPFAGVVLTHFLIAVSSALLMMGLSFWHRKSTPVSTIYWVLLLVAITGVSIAGWYGGTIAYGS